MAFTEKVDHVLFDFGWQPSLCPSEGSVLSSVTSLVTLATYFLFIRVRFRGYCIDLCVSRVGFA